MSLASLLNRCGTVSRTTLTDVGGGQWQETRVPQATGVRYRRWPAGSREIARGQALELSVSHQAAFEIDADVRRGDLLTDESDGTEYEVLRTDPDGSHHHLEVMLREREREAVA